MAEVTFICKQTSVSTKPVQPAGKITPLSILDRIMERNHLRVVFYYSFLTKRRAGEQTEKLRESISEMLSSFHVATGRLIRAPDDGRWMIKCNDAGVRMVEAKVNTTVHEWLQNVNREKELKLVHWEEMFHNPYFWSTFYVQVTEFEGGGLAIGLSCTHLLCDPICATIMIKAWADKVLLGEIKSPPLFQSLPSQREANKITNNNLINHYKSSMKKSPPTTSNSKQATIILQFNHETVRSCISMAAGNRKLNDHDKNLTPFQALAALFWTRISKVKGMKGSLVNMSICLDMREVLRLEKSFFGNCMVYNRVQGDGLYVKNDDLSKAATFIEAAVSDMDSDGVMGLIQWLEQENCDKNPPWMNGSDLICANLENVEAYSAIFEGNASPFIVSYYVEPAVGPGQIIILPSPEGDGPYARVAAVTLPEDEAERLLEDALIKQIGPTVLMGLNNYKKLS